MLAYLLCHNARLTLAMLALCLALDSSTAYAHGNDDEPDPRDIPGAHNAPCIEGASNEYPCLNMDLVQFMPLSTFNGMAASDIWGWTDPLTGFEYAILGLFRGTAFVRIDEHGEAHYLGQLPRHSISSLWRDMKVYKNHVYVVSEAFIHGMQVFDLTRLRDIAPADAPVTFNSDANYFGIRDAHNIAINEDTGYAYVVGAGSCSGGLHMIDIQNPVAPVFAGCFSADGYTHDTQCVIYHGPDQNYAGREICFNSNEDTLTIVDVTNKLAPVMLARAHYDGATYTHQGWLTEDHSYFLLGDELDELWHQTPTRTFVWDTSNLEAPFLTGFHQAQSSAIDHNLYVRGNHVFQANYRSGIRILRLGDLSKAQLSEVAFFDTVPADDAADFSGTWSVYPFFSSGLIVASDIDKGLYILRPHLDAIPECSDGIDNDGDGYDDYPQDLSCINADASSENIRFDIALALHPRMHQRPPAVFNSPFLMFVVPGSETVDVRKINLDSLQFRFSETEVSNPDPTPNLSSENNLPELKLQLPHTRPRDVNRDGRPDLVLKVLRKPTVVSGHTTACLSGLISGDFFEACVEA